MIREFVWASNFYIPDDDFVQFFESIGYNKGQMRNFDFMFDTRVVEYVKEHINFRESMRGKNSYQFKIGFAGKITPISVDTSRKWMIKYDNCDTPYPVYIEEVVNNYGFTYHRYAGKE